MNKVLIQEIIKILFLIDISDISPTKGFSEVFGKESLDKLYSYHASIKDFLESKEYVPVHKIFYFLLTSYLLGKSIDEDKISKLLAILESGGKYLALPGNHLSQFPKLKNARNKPLCIEVYTTFYGSCSFGVLGGKVSKGSLLSLVKQAAQGTGLYYSKEYSNTNLRYRFESEYTMNLIFVVALSKLFGLKIKLDKSFQWIMSNYKEFKSLASLFFSLNTLYQTNKTLLQKVDKKYVENFLKDRINNNGYFEYLLTDKRDEHMSSRSIIKWDVNSPHVFSTFYGVAVEKILGLDVLPKKEALSFLSDSQNEDGGFGRPVLVKGFGNPLNEGSSLLEALLALLFPSLL